MSFLFFFLFLIFLHVNEWDNIGNLFANYFDIIGDYKKLMVACVA